LIKSINNNLQEKRENEYSELN